LRDGDRREIEALGKDPRKALRYSFRSSLYPPQVALVDGEIAALWGLCGDMLSDVADPWLVTGKAIERAPISFVKIARGWIAEALQIKPRLENYVHADYTEAVRLLKVLGFHLDEPAPLGPRRALFRRFWIEV
jgi:hypothetical protein